MNGVAEMRYGVFQVVMGVLVGIAGLGGAHASAPVEKLVCTQAPRSEWMPEAKIRQIFGDKDYQLAKFKVSSGNCYEFYAVHHDGSIVEAYYNPVSGEVMRYNRVTSAPAALGYESRGRAPATPAPAR